MLRRLARLGSASLTLLAACSDILPPRFDYGTVEVKANTMADAPIEGVNLTLYTGTRVLAAGITDEDGNFRFELVPMGRLGVVGYAGVGYASPEDGAPFVVSTWYMDEGEIAEVALTFEGASTTSTSMSPTLRERE
jgi:hypothetical protein